jgi:protein-tyrosine phosphatase
MPEYIDLHLHLLPDVDDGPRSDEESIELARIIQGSGVTELVVTPHFNAWNPGLLATLEEVEDHVKHLRGTLEAAGVHLTIHPGAEHFLTPELIALVKAGHAPTLGPGPYILVEMPFDNRPLYVDELLYELALANLTPVLAHPERYVWVQGDPDAVEPLVARGVVLQLTAGSMSGHYGGRIKRSAEHLLERGLYGLVGSDLHRPGQPRLLSDMATAVTTFAGIDAARVLFQENPRRVLRGEPLLHLPARGGGEPKRRRFGLFG